MGYAAIINEMVINSNPEQVVRTKNGRPRSHTVLKLQWLAERVRKCERIKNEIAKGTYNVSSHDVAKSMLNLDLTD